MGTAAGKSRLICIFSFEDPMIIGFDYDPITIGSDYFSPFLLLEYLYIIDPCTLMIQYRKPEIIF